MSETLSNGVASSVASSVAPGVPSAAASVRSTSPVAHDNGAVSSRMEHFTRGPTSSGGRNMQDTTFSLSADYPSNYNIPFYDNNKKCHDNSLIRFKINIKTYEADYELIS